MLNKSIISKTKENIFNCRLSVFSRRYYVYVSVNGNSTKILEQTSNSFDVMSNDEIVLYSDFESGNSSLRINSYVGVSITKESSKRYIVTPISDTASINAEIVFL